MNYPKISALPQCLKMARVGDADRVFEGVQGVYSWNLPIPKPHKSFDRLKILPSILSKLSNTFSHEADIDGRRYSVAVERRKYDGAHPRKPENLGVDSLWSATHAIPLFSAPLYVGKCAGSDAGRGISQRIKEELDDKDVGQKITHAIRALELSNHVTINDFIIIALDIRKLAELTGEAPNDFNLINKISQYIESSIFWATFPPLNTKKGN